MSSPTARIVTGVEFASQNAAPIPPPPAIYKPPRYTVKTLPGIQRVEFASSHSVTPLILPHALSKWTDNQRVHSLIKARWEELVIEGIILGQKTLDSSISDSFPLQVELMERRLQRATLEAELYAAAIDAQKNERQRTIPTVFFTATDMDSDEDGDLEDESLHSEDSL